MLPKLLPFLNRFKSQNRQESFPNNQEVPADLSRINFENLILASEVPTSVLNRIYFFSIILMSVFIILALVNQGFKTALDSQKKEQMSLIATLESMKSKQDLILGVDKKIKFYQDFLLSRKNLGDKSDFIFDHVNPGLSVDKGTLEEDSFTITLEGENIYLFTQLIMQYLEGDKVSEVSITSANLNPSSKEFTVELKGTFK